MANIFQPSHFFSPEISDGELISQLGDVFQPELDRLQRAYSIRDPSIEQPSKTPSPSSVLYGVEYDEVNRTLVSVLALRWLHNDDYDVFTAGQPKGARLTRESFRWLQQRALDANVYGDADSLAALVTALVINDLGKDPQLAIDYREATGGDIASLNHDAVLLRACEAGMVAALKRLPDPQLRAEVVRGLELGADFNYGQLAQAESAPACLAHLRGFRNPADRHAVALHFVEQLLDIAGAAGHMDWTSARKLVEPIAQAYTVCHEVVQDILSRDEDGNKDGDTESLGASYNVVLVRRAEMLRDRGFARARALAVARPDDRALMRLLCMGGAADEQTATLFAAAWESDESLPPAVTRRQFVHSLNACGTADEPAVQPTYMPALLTQAVNAFQAEDQRRRALCAALRYLGRVLTAPLDTMAGGAGRQRATVVERNVLDVVKEVVQSPEFQDDPGILDDAAVPRGTAIMFSG